MRICFEAHRDQLDKTGIPYVFHPIHLAEQMDDEASVCVALLHDVVEDSSMTFDALSEEGFGEEIISALRLLTHDKSVPYMDYVADIKKNPLAKKVKLADLSHNSDLTRLDTVGEKDIARVDKYKAARAFLEA